MSFLSKIGAIVLLILPSLLGAEVLWSLGTDPDTGAISIVAIQTYNLEAAKPVSVRGTPGAVERSRVEIDTVAEHVSRDTVSAETTIPEVDLPIIQTNPANGYILPRSLPVDTTNANLPPMAAQPVVSAPGSSPDLSLWAEVMAYDPSRFHRGSAVGKRLRRYQQEAFQGTADGHEVRSLLERLPVPYKRNRSK